MDLKTSSDTIFVTFPDVRQKPILLGKNFQQSQIQPGLNIIGVCHKCNKDKDIIINMGCINHNMFSDRLSVKCPLGHYVHSKNFAFTKCKVTIFCTYWDTNQNKDIKFSQYIEEKMGQAITFDDNEDQSYTVLQFSIYSLDNQQKQVNQNQQQQQNQVDDDDNIEKTQKLFKGMKPSQPIPNQQHQQQQQQQNQMIVESQYFTQDQIVQQQIQAVEKQLQEIEKRNLKILDCLVNEDRKHYYDIFLHTYTKGKLIAKGQFAVHVYTHNTTKEEFAVKEMFTQDIDEFDQFKKEARLALQLNSFLKETVVQTYDYISYLTQIQNEQTLTTIQKAQCFVYIVMQKCEYSFKDFIDDARNRGQRLSPQILEKWLEECIKALEFFQQCKISHRDIKPANFLILNQKIKLADFGIITKVEFQENNLATMQDLAGTVAFWSPEKLELQKSMMLQDSLSIHFNEYKSDVYSLGLTFLYAASLREPKKDKFNRDQALLLNTLNQLKQQSFYSEKFIQVLECMLKEQQNNRDDFISLVKKYYN